MLSLLSENIDRFTRPKIPVFIFRRVIYSGNWKSITLKYWKREKPCEVHPQFSEISYREISFHWPFLPAFIEFSDEWFTIRKFHLTISTNFVETFLLSFLKICPHFREICMKSFHSFVYHDQTDT